jgi:hypothetical protein
MEHDVAARAADSPTEWLDLDAALLALPERYRVPVVLCHLQGLTRREAAERLGCAEGTLSARLHRALTRLRARLGSRDMAALAVAGAAATPSGLAAATARSATIYTTSTLAAAGVSPTVAGLTDGVLRMFWMKKMAAGLVLVGLVAAGLFAGLAGRSGDIARATDPTPTVPLVGEPQAPPEDPDAARKRLQQRRGELEKQKAELERRTADLNAQLEKFDAAFIDQMAAAELGTDLALVVTEGGKGVGWGKPSYTVREVVGGKLGEMSCYDLGILTTYLTRAFNDPKGPKKVRIHADQNFSHDQIHKVLAACARAGFKTALFILPEAPLITTLDPKTRKPEKAEYGQKEKTIDLAGYADPKKP